MHATSVWPNTTPLNGIETEGRLRPVALLPVVLVIKAQIQIYTGTAPTIASTVESWCLTPWNPTAPPLLHNENKITERVWQMWVSTFAISSENRQQTATLPHPRLATPAKCEAYRFMPRSRSSLPKQAGPHRLSTPTTISFENRQQTATPSSPRPTQKVRGRPFYAKKPIIKASRVPSPHTHQPKLTHSVWQRSGD